MSKKRIVFENFGMPEDVLKTENDTISPLKDDEILVEMILSPINPSDLIPVTGAYRHRIELPGIPGYEGVGKVVEIGSKVNPKLLNTRVLPLRGEGTWQTKVKCPARFAVPVPDEIDDYTAACLYINPVTAWIICSRQLNLMQGDVLVVNACGSFIGRLFAQYSRIFGYTLIAVVRNEKHTEDLMSLGASFVIDTSKENVRASVFDITGGKGADAAVDCVGGHAGTELSFTVKPGGCFLTLGLLSGRQVDWQRIHEETKVKESLFHLRHWNADISIEDWHRTFSIIIEKIIKGRLTLDYFDRVFNLSEAVEAVRYLNTGENKGKVFLKNNK